MTLVLSDIGSPTCDAIYCQHHMLSEFMNHTLDMGIAITGRQSLLDTGVRIAVVGKEAYSVAQHVDHCAQSLHAASQRAGSV